MLRTPWWSALMSSSTTFTCFDHSIKMSVSTAHKLSECFWLDCTCGWLCESGLPVMIMASFNYYFHRFSEQNHSGPALLTGKDDPKSEMDLHHCKLGHLFKYYNSLFSFHNSCCNFCLWVLTSCLGTFSYRINSRLFPIPLHSQECCPVCKKDKSSHPHTTAEPALVR